jgi:endonuclease-3
MAKNKTSRLRTQAERDQILKAIYQLYPEKTIELDFETPFQLLIAVILSAQMTDKGVNKATQILFTKVKNPADLIQLEEIEVEKMLRSINYYRVKTRHIIQTAQKLTEDYHGEIPDSLKEIQKLPGVGIKTAKVVLSHLFDMPFIGVDTHIHRVMNRMGIVKTSTPAGTDKKLEKILTNEQKRTMHHAIVLFGRYVCTAKKCRCSETVLKEWCQCSECRAL